MRRYTWFIALVLLAGMREVDAQPLQWKSLQSKGMHGIMMSVTASDGSILVAHSRYPGYEPISFFRSRDNGDTWLFESASIENSLQVVALPDSLVMMLGNTTASKDMAGFAHIMPLELDDNFRYMAYQGALFCITDTLVVSTKNKGFSWSERKLENSGTLRATAIGADGNLYLLGTNAIWRLQGLSSQWERFSLPQAETASHVAVSRSGLLFLGDYNKLRTVRIENDSIHVLSSKLDYVKSLAVSPSGNVYRFSDRLSRTSDDGNTWDTLSYPYNFTFDKFNYTFDSSGNLFLFMDNESYKIGDTHPTFRPISVPNVSTNPVRTDGNGTVMAASGYYLNGTEISTDHGVTWRYMLPIYTRRIDYRYLGTHPALGTWLLLNYADQGHGDKVNWYYLLYSQDGVYWTQSERLPNVGELRYLATDHLGRIFFHDPAHGLTVSDASGLHFTSVANSLAGDQFEWSPGIDVNDELLIPGWRGLAHMDLADPAQVKLDSQQHISWLFADDAGNHIGFKNGNEPFAWYQGEYVTMDTLPVRGEITDVAFAQGKWYVATDTGLFCSSWMHPSSIDKSWQRCDETLADKFVLSIAFDGLDRLYVGTQYSGLYVAQLSTAGVEEIQPQPTLSVFPDPASDRINIRSGMGPLFIYDQIGRIVYQGQIDRQQQRIDVSGLTAGSYLARTESGSITFLIAR
jgi:hypothetical protein